MAVVMKRSRGTYSSIGIAATCFADTTYEAVSNENM